MAHNLITYSIPTENDDIVVAFFPVWTKRSLLISPEVRSGDGHVYFIGSDQSVCSFRYTEQNNDRSLMALDRNMYDAFDFDAIEKAVKTIIEHIKHKNNE